MQPMTLTIRKSDVSQWLAMLLERCAVIAPVAGPCGEIMFSEVDSPREVLWNFENPLCPPKQFVLPQTDPIVRIECGERGTRVSPMYDDKPRVLFNIRPCDVKGIAFLTRMHEMEPADASYLRRAANLTLISLACDTPCPQGFCICSESGPFLHNHFDVQLTGLGEKYLAEIGSEKGQAAISGVAELFAPASAEELEQRAELEAEAARRFGEQTCHFASGMRRICYCFSVKDRANRRPPSDGTSNCAVWTRCRIWDSCQYPAFTLEASGHNPRQQRCERMKRRFFHKVSAQYYLRDGMSGCVGCGRCIKVCLGATNMPAVVAAIRKRVWRER